jgi:hypothetical protein
MPRFAKAPGKVLAAASAETYMYWGWGSHGPMPESPHRLLHVYSGLAQTAISAKAVKLTFLLVPLP